MAGKVCAFEKQYKVTIHKDNLVSEGIETALKAEKRDQQVYANNAAKTGNYRLKELFTHLAAEETRHIKELEDLKECLKATRRWSEIKSKKSALPESVAGDAAEAFDATKDEVEAVLGAMKGERAAEEFYRKMASHAGKDGKKFFEKLAEMEAKHYEVLDKLFQDLEESAVKLAGE